MTNHFTFSGAVEQVVPKSTATGYQVLTVRLAQTRNYGKTGPKTETVEVTLFGDMATSWSNLKRGMKIMVSGKVSGRTNNYNGKEYFNLSLVGNEIALVSEAAGTENFAGEESDIPF